MALPIKLKVGDICIPQKGGHSCGTYGDIDRANELGRYLEIISLDGNGGVTYGIFSKEGKRISACNCFKENDLMKLSKRNKKTLIQSMKYLFRLLVDKDVQVLSKAGFLDGDLELTEEGESALLSLLFTDKKKELVAMAEEAIKEAEKAAE